MSNRYNSKILPLIERIGDIFMTGEKDVSAEDASRLEGFLESDFARATVSRTRCMSSGDIDRYLMDIGKYLKEAINSPRDLDSRDRFTVTTFLAELYVSCKSHLDGSRLYNSEH